MLRLASFAALPGSPLGGFLYGMIIPIPTYPLSSIHPEGSIPSSNPEGVFSAVSSSPFRVRVKSPSGP